VDRRRGRGRTAAPQPGGPKPAAEAKRSFAEVAEHWRSAQVHADTTAAAVGSDLRNHILPTFGEQEIGRIRHSEIQAWVKRLSEKLAPATVERAYRWLAAIFRMAVNDDIIRRSPCFGIKLPAKPEAKVEPLRREAVEALLDALPARYRALAIVGAGAGLRQGKAFEALGHKTAIETLNTYGHLWPDDAGLTRRAVDEVLGPCVASRQAM